MNYIKFDLVGLTCNACIKLATNRIMKVPGVQNVEIDLATGNAVVGSLADLDLEILAQSLEGTQYSIVR